MLVVLWVLVCVAGEGFRKGVELKGSQVFVVGVGEVCRSGKGL